MHTKVVLFVALLNAAVAHVTFEPVDPVIEARRQRVEEVAAQAREPKKREAAIHELLVIAKDGEEATVVRNAAVRALVAVEATEAVDSVGELASGLNPQWPADVVDDDSLPREVRRRAGRAYHDELGLKDNAATAYWELRVMKESSQAAKDDLLISLLREDAPAPHGQSVAPFAMRNLANRGVERALPDILRCVRRVHGKDRYAQDIAWLYQNQIRVLNSYPTRFDALKDALTGHDVTQHRYLWHWAIKELAKLPDGIGLQTLIDYAGWLEDLAYDEDGQWIEAPVAGPATPSEGQMASLYRDAVRSLREAGVSNEEMKAAGLKRNKCFISSESGPA